MESSSTDRKTFYDKLSLAAIKYVQKKSKNNEAVESADQPSTMETEENPSKLGDKILTCIPVGRKPLILGVALHDKQLVYLVHWQQENKISESPATAIDGQEDYGKGLTNTNTNVVLASAFKEVYPQIAIKLYESKMLKTETPSLTEEQEVQEAERLLKLKKTERMTKKVEKFKEGLVQNGDLEEELKDDDAAIAILRERRMKDMFDPETSSSESDDDEIDCVMDLEDDDDEV